MSSFDKTVKLACKPKAAPPKAKYIDPIIAATYSEDGAVIDVCRALSMRLREPNSIVVFKGLIVLHTMIRNGATDNVLSYLSSSDVLRLRSVSTGHWEGYDTPRNLQNYAIYLDTRIRTYKELKHDPVRVQSEENRDARVEREVGTTAIRGTGPQRSKTIMGRKLRSMTVEKGLLRETKGVQRAMASLVECQFYFDNLEDDLSVTALRMLVKDLLILFQALNEGVINVLEHYFEMSHVDAESALAIYRNFCKQTERAVEYLGVARKLQNLLNVPIPNLKLAPVSLVSALEEYLNDPNFEQNRIEYKTTKAMADKNAKDGKKTAPDPRGKSESAAAGESSSMATRPPLPKVASENQALVDFFSSIEEEQPLNLVQQAHNQVQPQLQYQQTFQQPQALQPMQTGHNPFAMRQSMIITGAMSQNPLAQPQSNGFVQPQQTGFPTFPQQPSSLSSQHPSFQSFLQQQQQQPQPTGFPQAQQLQPTGFLQPQQTGANPFRQSMLLPQTTSMPMFGGLPQISESPQRPLSAFPQSSGQMSFSQNASLFGPTPLSNATSNPVPAFGIANDQQLPQRPASTPLAGSGNAFEQPAKVVSHQTGSRNPFGVPVEAPPPVPKMPTLQELRTGLGSPPSAFSLGNNEQNSFQTTAGLGSTFNPTFSATPTTGQHSIMANVASSFLKEDPNKPASDMTGAPSITSQFTSTTGFSTQPTGSTGATSNFSSSVSPLQLQTTGFSGIKAFKPTSSFGASLLESLPPIPQSSPATPSGGTSSSPAPAGLNGAGSAPSLGSLGTSFSSPDRSSMLPSTATSSFSTFSSPGRGNFVALNSQPTGMNGFSGNTGSSVGVGLRPQMTGGGVANPFRASMFGSTPGAHGVPPLPTMQFGVTGMAANPTGAPSFGGSAFPQFGQLGQQQQQHQPQTDSLI